MLTMNSMTVFFRRKVRGTTPGYFQFKLSGLKFSAILLLAALLAVSCEEDPTQIGAGLLPGGDLIGLRSTDTISVSAFTMYNPSVETSNLSYQFLGKVYDPYFGSMRAGFVTQLRLLAKWKETAFPITIDSLMLNFRIDAVRGDTLATQTLRIFETSEVIYPDSIYHSDKNVQTVSEIASFTIPALKKDTSLRFRMPDLFAEYLMRDTSKLFHAAHDPDFRHFFRGLYFTLDDSPNPVIYNINLPGGGINMNLYYRDSSGVAKNYYFLMNERSARYNTYIQDFNAAEPAKKILHLNDGIQDTISFQQAINGVYTRIKIPGLQRYRDSTGISVNKARLIIPVYYDGDSYKEENNPVQVILTYTSFTGERIVVHDYLMDNNASFFGGKYSTDKKAYILNIPTFAQRYLRGEVDNPEVDILIPAGIWNNIIFKTPKNTDGIRFEFTYSWF